FLWRWRTSEKQSRLVATGDYAPSILSPWRAADVESLLEEADVVETHCDFCMARYSFDAVDVAALFSDAMPAEKEQ
ncbi:hypothetical protein BOW52_09880, partial [Solemya elarraichensis gill symbiont]